MNHIVIELLSTCTRPICYKLIIILLDVLKVSFFYLPTLRIMARELHHLVSYQAPKAWILACKKWLSWLQ